MNARMYSIKEVAERLGLSYKTVWKWTRKNNTVRAVVYESGTVRIPESELMRLLADPPQEAQKNAQA